MQTECIGDATLYRGDCLEILPTLGGVDAVVTDPPYELSSSGPGVSHFGMSLSKFDSDAYAEIVGGVDYESLLSGLAAICAPFNMFCFCSNKQISRLMSLNEAEDRATTLLVWHKVNAAPFANGVWRGDIEYIVHARGKGATFRGGAVEKKKVSEHPTVVDASHPTVKPIALIEKFVGIGAERDAVVLDPFMGSGTTGVACANLGRKFIGIEIEQKYLDIACERITAAYAQGRLFA